MSIDTGRERTDEARQRRAIDRLTPAAKPGQTGERLAPFPSQESADQSKPREGSESSGSEEEAKEGARGASPPPTWLRRLRYYGLALIFVGGAALLRWALADALTPAPFLVFYLAWVGAAAFGGLGPGLLATLASWLCIDLLFDATPGEIGFADPMSIARLWVFLAGGLVVSAVGETMRRTRIHERRQGRELADANAALRANEEKYRRLVEKINDWVWEIDADGVYTYSSPRVLELLGYRPEEIVGKMPFDLMPPAEAQRVWNAFRPIWLVRKPLELLENTLVRKDGRLVTVETSGMPVFAEDGSFLGYTGIDRDVTSRKEAEEALRESEERFRKIFEEGPIGMVLTSRDFGFFRANPAFCRMLGYTSEEMNGLTFLDVTHPEHRAADRDNVERLWQGEIPIYRTEKRYIAKNGDIRWGNMSASLIQDREGRPLYALAIVEDITERQWAEEQLRRNEQDLNRAQAVAQTGSWRLNVRRNELLWSKETHRIFGIPIGTPMTYETFLAAVHPADQEYVNRQWTAALRGEPFDIEYRIVVDGQLKWVRGRAELEFDEEGTLLGGFGTVQDITARKRAEEVLRSSQSMLQLVMENVPQGIFWKDRQSTYLGCNHVFAQAAGLEFAADIIGKTDYDLPWLPEQAASYREYDRRVMESDAAEYHIIEQQREVTGELAWVETNKVPLHDAQGQVIGILGTYEVITERQRAEEALREWNVTLESRVAKRTEELVQRARELQKLTLELTEAEERERKRLAEILHDDLQQVLAAAKFQVSLLSSRMKNDADSQEIAGQAQGLLVDAIAKSRSLSHELSAPALSQSDLGEAFEWLAEQMQKKHGLTVHLDMGERLGLASEPLRVLLYKAAQESLFNVVKHAGVGEARLRVRRRCGRVRLSVSDRGRGFDPTEPGYHLGFGLLSIRERVGYLGGRMKIRSIPGQGSTFILTMPDSDARAPAPSAETPAISGDVPTSKA